MNNVSLMMDRLSLVLTWEQKQKIEVRHQKICDWYMAQTWGNYEQKSPFRDPKWDPKVKQLCKAWADYSLRETYACREQVLDLARELQDMGCNDPMLYFMGSNADYDKDPYALLTYERVSKVAEEWAYSPYLQFLMNYSVLEEAQKSPLLQLEPGLKGEFREPEMILNALVAQLTQLVASTDIPPEILCDLSQKILCFFERKGDIKDGMVLVEAAFQGREGPPGALKSLRGSFLLSWGWEARGSGYADTVSAAQWKTAQKRIDQAETMLTAADEENPFIPLTALTMMNVERFQGKGRYRIEKWFSKALKAGAMPTRAYGLKMEYLEPKWYGSPEAMLQFAQACFETGNFENEIVFALSNVHRRLSTYSANPSQYFLLPGVWENIHLVFEEYLKQHPNSVFYRSVYIRYAYLCNHPEIGGENMKLLGQNVVLEEFESRKEFQSLVPKEFWPVHFHEHKFSNYQRSSLTKSASSSASTAKPLAIISFPTRPTGDPETKPPSTPTPKAADFKLNVASVTIIGNDSFATLQDGTKLKVGDKQPFKNDQGQLEDYYEVISITEDLVVVQFKNRKFEFKTAFGDFDRFKEK